MIKYYFIRHGKTYGNVLKRYIGTTDEPLLFESKQELKNKIYPKVDAVFVSPMLRCRQTAELIYKEMKPFVQIPQLAECNFGEFENKNYLELSNHAGYQAWIDSNGTLPFPGGEDISTFKKRCINGFLTIEQLAQEYQFGQVAIIAHGGTIMSIFEKYGTPKRDYYQWLIATGDYLTLIR